MSNVNTNTVNRLALVLGTPSPMSLGLTATLAADQVPDAFDFLSEQFGTLDTSGHTDWRPASPALKNGGVWTDSNSNDGRQLVSAPVGNVTETIRLVIKDNQPNVKAEAVARLNYFITQARAFHTEGWQPFPVYLELRFRDARGSQYALVYNIEPNLDTDLFIGEAIADLTITIEREPYWRGVPPGANPRLWTFYKQGRLPGIDYDYTNLDLSDVGSDDLAIANVYPFDEIGTANVNYIDIDARAPFASLTNSLTLDGDAPALALVSFFAPATGINRLLIARSTRRDLYPANNNNATTQRARATFNGGDITINSGNPVVTKVINATGVLSNGSIANRYVLQAVYAAGTISGTSLGSWSRVINQYPGKYEAFLRAQVTAGTDIATKFYLEYAIGAANINTQQTIPVRLNQTGFGTTSLGIVDFTILGNKYVGSNGLGLDAITTFTLRLQTLKTTAETPTVLVWDLILMPIDEPNGMLVINFAALSGNDLAFLDATGYFAGGQAQDAAVTKQSGTDYQRRMTGTAITLMPNLVNRLYFLMIGSSPGPTLPATVAVNIVPRWSNLRDF